MGGAGAASGAPPAGAAAIEYPPAWWVGSLEAGSPQDLSRRLMQATLGNRAAEVQSLLAQGARLDGPWPGGFTPLHAAVLSKCIEALPALLRAAEAQSPHGGVDCCLGWKHRGEPSLSAVFSQLGFPQFSGKECDACVNLGKSMQCLIRCRQESSPTTSATSAPLTTHQTTHPPLPALPCPSSWNPCRCKQPPCSTLL